LKKLNLGSGGRPLTGYVNVDVLPTSPKVDMVYDLNTMPWPFETDSVDEIVMAQCLEHLVDHNAAMREIHRILKPGGVAIISVPHFTWQLAYADPTHKHFFAYPTFFYYTGRGGYFDFAFSKCSIKIEFGKRLSLWNYLIEPFANLFPTVYEQSPLRIFPALAIKAWLTK
jgi:SAM-dependent methyltransferase